HTPTSPPPTAASCGRSPRAASTSPWACRSAGATRCSAARPRSLGSARTGSRCFPSPRDTTARPTRSSSPAAPCTRCCATSDPTWCRSKKNPPHPRPSRSYAPPAISACPRSCSPIRTWSCRCRGSRAGGDRWHLTVVGDGPDRERLERLASDLRLAARVRWAGALPPEDVRKLWPELDVLVLPARALPTWAEPAAHVVAEAMAYEVAVV